MEMEMMMKRNQASPARNVLFWKNKNNIGG